MPTFSKQALVVWGAFFSSYQEQLLQEKTNDKELLFTVEEVLHRIGGGQRNKQFVIEVLSNLGGLRYLLGGYQSLALFSSERWDALSLSVYLRPKEVTTEILTGYVNLYANTMRSGDKSPLCLQGEHPPVEISRSFWLEASGVERLVALRLLGLLGQKSYLADVPEVYEVCLESLYKGLRKHSKFRGSDLLWKIRSWTTLCRKLHLQGVIRKKHFTGGCLKSSNSSDFSILVQPCSPLDQSTHDHLLCQLSLKYIRALLQPSIEAFVRFFGKGVSEQSLQMIQNEVSREILPSLDLYSKSFLQDDTGGILPLILLFLEWKLRSQSGHLLPVILWRELSELINRPVSKENFSRFSSLMKEEFYSTVVLNSEFFTLTSQATRSSSQFQRYCDSPFDSVSHKRKPLETQTIKPFSHVPQSNSHYQDKDFLPNIGEQLKSLSRYNKKKYLRILDFYYSSLDSTSKAIMEKLKKDLSLRLFTEHLHKKLVWFVSKNLHCLEDIEGNLFMKKDALKQSSLSES